MKPEDFRPLLRIGSQQYEMHLHRANGDMLIPNPTQLMKHPGVSADSLQRWIHGPSFLVQPCETWPQRPVDMRYISNDDPEIKKSAKVYANSTNPPFDFITNVFQHFSSWSHLKKIVAWILCYKANLQRVSNDRKKGKTTDIHPTDAIIPLV